MMKVMSKKLGESIRVGSDVVVTLLSVRGGTIRVGVSAPEDIPIEHDPVDRMKPSPAPTAVELTNAAVSVDPVATVSTPVDETVS